MKDVTLYLNLRGNILTTFQTRHAITPHNRFGVQYSN